MTKEEKKFFNTKFDSIDKKFDSIDKRFDSIDKRFDKIESRLDKLEEWTKIADKKFDLIEHKFVEIDNRFDQLEKYVASRFAEFERKLDTFIEELDTIRKVSQIHTIKIGRIETGYSLKNK
jgi:hypothetical protein